MAIDRDYYTCIYKSKYHGREHPYLMLVLSWGLSFRALVMALRKEINTFPIIRRSSRMVLIIHNGFCATSVSDAELVCTCRRIEPSFKKLVGLFYAYTHTLFEIISHIIMIAR